MAAQTPAGAGRNLSVVSAGPTGEVASLAEANEIRIVFSEPMVSLGRIPSVVQAALRDDHAGHPWRVSLVGDDDPHLHCLPRRPPLPYATRYDVTVDATAAAVSGRTLGKAYTFSFIDADGEAAPNRNVSSRRAR